MNGWQRIHAALKGEWPDKRPIMLHNFMLAAREAGMTMEEYCSDPEKAAWAHIEAVEKYDLYGVLIDFDTATLPAEAAAGPVVTVASLENGPLCPASSTAHTL